MIEFADLVVVTQLVICFHTDHTENAPVAAGTDQEEVGVGDDHEGGVAYFFREPIQLTMTEAP